MDRTAILEVIDAAKRLDARGLVNAYEGNVSVCRDGFLYITPTTTNKAYLTEDLIAVFEVETMRQVAGKLPASSEILLHTNTYRIRPEIGGIVHCHPTMLTAYAVCGRPIVTRTYPEMMCHFGEIPCAPYGRPGTADIFTNAEEYLRRYPIVLLGNHGAVALGDTVQQAMCRMEAAEAIAKVLYYSERLGTPNELPEQEVAALTKTYPLSERE